MSDHERTSLDDEVSSREATLFGNYRLKGLLGHGGFASVYRAEFQGEFGFRKDVALKVLRRRLGSLEEEVSSEFLNEARLGASIRHPNLVEFYECGRVGDRLYMAMELIAGPNLAQVLRMVPDLVPELDDQLILAIAMQTARGLKGLHEAKLEGRVIGAIHRDLKPGNILLSNNGQAKITDYGITRFAADFYQTLDHKGPRGSPLYMSPEQAKGEPLSQASDVFSFGTTVLEMITGTPVFAASSVMGIIKRVRDADVGEALATARERFPRLVWVLENSLVTDTDSRIQNGAELVEALKVIEPPPFGEELIAQLSTHAYEILESHQQKRQATPVLKFWSHLTGDGAEVEEGDEDAPKTARLGPEDGQSTPPPVPEPIGELIASVSGELDLEKGGEFSTRQEAVVDRSAPPQKRGSAMPWVISTGVMAILVLVVLVIAFPGLRTALIGDPETPTEGGDPTEAVTGDGVVEAGTEAGTETGTEAETETESGTESATEKPTEKPTERPTEKPTEEPTGEPTTDDGLAVEPPTEEPTEDAAPTVRHDPASRAIRGQDIPVRLTITPPGGYSAKVWYRAIPDGAWQTRVVTSTPDGGLSVTIAAGDWQGEGATDVEYFVEIDAPGGMLRSGSAVRPYRLRLF